MLTFLGSVTKHALGWGGGVMLERSLEALRDIRWGWGGGAGYTFLGSV